MAKTIIYSNEKIEGLVGNYANPAYFAGCVKGATLVHTDSNPIKEAYEAKGVEVKPLKVAKKRTKKGAE